MRVEVKPDREYAWFIRPFFWLQKRNYGQVLIPGKCWGRSPRLFAAVATLYGVINRKRSPIDPVLRSLVTVRVSQLNWCRFCVDINAMTLVKRAGSSEKVEALANWRESPLFDEREKAVLDYTEAMTGLDGVSDEQAARLKPWFDDDAMVELTGLIAFQNMSAKFNAALDIAPQGFCQLPVQPERSCPARQQGRLMNRTRLLLALVMGSLIGTFFALDLGRYLSLDALQAQQAAVAQWVDSHFVSASLLFVLIYVLSTALSLPGASLLTLGGSAVFGVAWGLLLVSFASTLGATLAFLSARFLLRDWVTARFGDKLATFQSGMAKEGAFYLLSLRLIPIFPFFLVNLLMGLTPIRVSTYYWVSQLGMLPGTFVYVLAGSELGQLTSTGNILSPGLMVALTLLGLMPWLVKKLTAHLAQRRLLTPYRKPARYDYNLLVIGAGAGGLVTSYIAAAVKAKVALIEKHKMGGDCLNSGCVPSKALIRSARFAAEQRKADELGFSPSHSRADFAAVMERVAEVIKEVEPHDSIEALSGAWSGVHRRRGAAGLSLGGGG